AGRGAPRRRRGSLCAGLPERVECGDRWRLGNPACRRQCGSVDGLRRLASVRTQAANYDDFGKAPRWSVIAGVAPLYAERHFGVVLLFCPRGRRVVAPPDVCPRRGMVSLRECPNL